MRIAITILSTLLAISCAADRTLPELTGVTHIEFRSQHLETQRIGTAEDIENFMNFYNNFSDGWTIPWYGPPVAKVHFDLYSNEKIIGNFGVSRNFITRTYGDFWSQFVEEAKIEKFARSSHPALAEALYLKIPDRVDKAQVLENWKKKLEELSIGATKTEIELFIRKNNVSVNNRNEGEFNLGYWWNIELEIVNEGQYVNTVIAAQFVLNEDLSLKNKRFFGFQHSKKGPN